MKVYCQKQISNGILIGKVERKGKTKWIMSVRMFGEYSFRKSKFSNIKQFEEFLRSKYNLG